MAYYKDLHEYLAALEKVGKLTRIRSKINKDTELHPLIRLQFLGLPEEQRTAFLFENITDSKGKQYRMPYVVGCAAASRDIYNSPQKLLDTFRRTVIWHVTCYRPN